LTRIEAGMAPAAGWRFFDRGKILEPLHQANLLRALRSTPAWRLLSADNAAAVVAMLQARLLTKDRKLPASLLVERPGRDLERLRAEGWDLPQAASAYLSDWLAAIQPVETTDSRTIFLRTRLRARLRIRWCGDAHTIGSLPATARKHRARRLCIRTKSCISGSTTDRHAVFSETADMAAFDPEQPLDSSTGVVVSR